MALWTVTDPQRLTIDEPVRRLDVRLISGRLHIVGTDGPARVEVSEVKRKLIIETRDGVLTIRHEKERTWPGFIWWIGNLGRRLKVDVSVAVPRETMADLRLVDGSLVASGLRSGLDARVTSGKITLLGLDGPVTAKLVSGSVEALGVGGDLTMETISGELTLADSTAGRVRGSTVSGSITCDLDNPAGGEIRLNTTSGQITVRVREDSELNVRLHTLSGRITSAFGGLVADGRKDVRGVIGAGLGTLDVSSTSGNIALLASPVGDEEADR